MTNYATKIRLLIVEDEPLAARLLQETLSEFNYETVSIVNNANDAIAVLSASSEIDIVLIDIVLKGDIDGIDLASYINENHDLPFIFLTSHTDNEVMERAKGSNPYAFIVKPFKDEQIKIALEMALINFSNKTSNNMYKTIDKTLEISTALQIKDSLFLKRNHHFDRVHFSKILFLEADNNYCTVHTTNAKYIYSLVLKKIEEQLPTDQFLRVHRSYVVNVQSITGFEGNMLFIGSSKIPVSKTHRNKVFKLFHMV